MDTNRKRTLTMFGDQMKLKISRDEAAVAFDFEAPTPLHMLIVSDSSEEVQWEIASERAGPEVEMPVSSESASVLDSGFVAVRVPAGVVRALSKAVEADRMRHPHVSRVVYGQLPPGFCEVAGAKELKAGQTYCVVVFGGGLDSASEFFTA